MLRRVHDLGALGRLAVQRAAQLADQPLAPGEDVQVDPLAHQRIAMAVLALAGTVLAALLAPHAEGDAIQALATQGVTAFAMELLPRISRAQSMSRVSEVFLAGGG